MFPLTNGNKLFTCSVHNYSGMNNPCPECRHSERKVELELKMKFHRFIINQKDVPKEIVDMINRDFWDLI